MVVLLNTGYSPVGLLVDDVKDYVICGLLLCLRQLIPLVTKETDDILLLPKIYCLLLRCCLHNNHNVVTSALEVLFVLLGKPLNSLVNWLTTELDHITPLCPVGCHGNGLNEDDAKLLGSSPPSSVDDVVVTSSPSNDDTLHNKAELLAPSSPSNSDNLESSLSDTELPSPSSPSDSDIPVSLFSSHDADRSESPTLSHSDSPVANNDSSLLTPCDDHFVVSLSATDASVSVSLASAHPSSATPLLSCDFPIVDVTALQLPGATTCSTPVQALLQLVGTRLLTLDHVRVSVKVVSMQCIVAIAMWSPQQLLITIETENNARLIELLLPYMDFDDPKLCGTCCQVLSYYIRGMLLWDTSDQVISVSSAVEQIVKTLTSKSATTLHTAIPSIQVNVSA